MHSNVYTTTNNKEDENDCIFDEAANGKGRGDNILP
jgi:hypothetical protein